MTRTEQRKFVRDLASEVLKGVLESSSRWPETWDGHQLRGLLAAKFEDANCGKLAPPTRGYHGPAQLRAMRAARKEFKNDLIVCNL